ncbi:MAG: PAS domain S-box protein [Candidatus Methylomirabilia bacterium]
MSRTNSFLTLDPELTIVAWTAGVADIFGYEPAEILGRPVFALVPDDQRQAAADVLAKTVTEGRVAGFATQRLTKSGGRINIVADLLAIRSEDGKHRATQITVRRV